MSDKVHQTVYLPRELLEEIKAEAVRQDRSLSWVLKTAWVIARAKIVGMHPGRLG